MSGDMVAAAVAAADPGLLGERAETGAEADEGDEDDDTDDAEATDGACSLLPDVEL